MGLPEIEAAHWLKQSYFVCVAQRFDVVETYFDTLLCVSDYKRRCARLISTLLNLAFNKKLETGGPKFTAKGQHSLTEDEETFQRERWDKRSFSIFGMCLFSHFSPSLLLNFCNQALFDFN